MDFPIEHPEIYAAALYIRLSREDEADGPSQSVENQLAMLTDFVRAHALPVYDSYIDDGWSGTNFDRPAFRRMLADIEAGRVNLVVTKDLSRLGRDYIGTGHYMERWFPEHRVRYISLLDGIDTGVESAANDITPFRAVMNDMYAKDISKKIGSVKHDKQRRGVFIGGKAPYGYRLSEAQKGRLLVDEPAALVVRRVFSLALEGRSCRRIADALNAEGTPPPAVYAELPRQGCGLWRGESVSALLRNEVYTGSMVQGRTRRASYKSKKCVRQPEDCWCVVPGTHEALVSREDFEAVSRLLAAKQQTRERSHPFLLKGLIFCRECGAPLGVVARKTAAGETLYFICRTYQAGGRAGSCTSHNARAEEVTGAVLAAVRQLRDSALREETLLAEAEAALAEAGKARLHAAGQDARQARLDALARQIDRAYRDRLEGTLTEEDFSRIYARLCAARSAAAQAPADAAPSPLPDAAALAAGFREEAPGRELLCALLSRIELGEDRRVVLRFRCRPPCPPP